VRLRYFTVQSRRCIHKRSDRCAEKDPKDGGGEPVDGHWQEGGLEDLHDEESGCKLVHPLVERAFVCVCWWREKKNRRLDQFTVSCSGWASQNCGSDQILLLPESMDSVEG